MMALLSNSLFQRIVSSLVLAPAVLAAIWYGGWGFWALLLIAFCIAVYEWLSASSKTDLELPASVFGIVYLAFCIACFALLRDKSVWLVLCMLCAVWASDSGAYFAGKMIGGPKMAPTISPNKTWAGMGGAIVGAAAAFIIFGAFDLFHGGIVTAIFYGAVIAVSGQIGDLLISKLKRRAGIKDTGHLIPGHGGLLDRIDSLLLASAIFFFVLKIMSSLS